MRRTSPPFILAALLSLILFGCSPKEPADPAALRTTFASENQRFMAAFARRDPGALAQLYAEDAQVYPPNAAPVAGRPAIQELWRGFLESPVGRIELTTTEAEGSELSAWETGRYTLLGANGSTVDEGKYVVVWRRQGDLWKIYRDMWSSNMPAAAPATRDTTR